MTTEMINSKKSDGEYITPSCSILSIVEESMIAASPGPPTPSTPSEPEGPSTPTKETPDVTNPNYAKQHHYYDVWKQW